MMNALKISRLVAAHELGSEGCEVDMDFENQILSIASLDATLPDGTRHYTERSWQHNAAADAFVCVVSRCVGNSSMREARLCLIFIYLHKI